MEYVPDLTLPEKIVLLNLINHDNRCNLLPNQVSFGVPRPHPVLIDRYVIPADLTDLETNNTVTIEFTYSKVSIQKLFMITGVVVPTTVTTHDELVQCINGKYGINVAAKDISAELSSVDILDLSVGGESTVYAGKYRAYISDAEWKQADRIIKYSLPKRLGSNVSSTVNVVSLKVIPKEVVNTCQRTIKVVSPSMVRPRVVNTVTCEPLLRDSIVRVNLTATGLVKVAASQLRLGTVNGVVSHAFDEIAIQSNTDTANKQINYRTPKVLFGKKAASTYVSIKGILNE